MRLFIGIFPPKEVLDNIRDILRKFNKQKRQLELLPVDQIHATLKFIGGKVTEGSMNLIIDGLKHIEGTYERPLIQVKGLSFGFPHQSNPRVLMAKITKSNELKALTQQVHEVVKEQRMRDTMTWKQHNSSEHHLTLGRMKDNATRKVGKEFKKIADEYKDLPFGEFQAEEIYLVESEFRMNKGVSYRKLERIML